MINRNAESTVYPGASMGTQIDYANKALATRKGDWMQTYSGGQFWPLDPRASEVNIQDIAHALSNKCRYNGHSQFFYGVAEHSVHIADWLHHNGHGPVIALWGLLHDAGEAYLPDIIRPIKVQPEMAHMRGIEANVMAAVCEKFGLDPTEPAIVKHADSRILLDERDALMSPVPAPWNVPGEPLGVEIEGWWPSVAKDAFLAAFWRYNRDAKAAA